MSGHKLWLNGRRQPARSSESTSQEKLILEGKPNNALGGGKNGTRDQWRRAMGLRRPPQGGGQRPRDPDAMEIDETRMNKPLTDEERKKLMAKGRVVANKGT
jgi:hypothetical protein